MFDELISIERSIFCYHIGLPEGLSIGQCTTCTYGYSLRPSESHTQSQKEDH